MASTLTVPVDRPLRLHQTPPTSPSAVVLGRRWVMWTLLVAFVALAVAASIDSGALLLHVDLPIERWVQDHRTAGLDSFFRHVSFFGSTKVVLLGGAALALIALPKCRLASALIVFATLLRPPFEWTVKDLVDRPRPDLGQLVNGVGPSFPCGHVLAASVLWCMVPLVVSLYIPSRRVWWFTAGFCVLAIALIGASRVYLGVHWPTDVVGGFIAGALLVAVLDQAFHVTHSRRRCTMGPVRRDGG